MDSRFEEAIQIVLRNEGGFSNDPGDLGGATMFGISLRFLRQLNLHILDNKEIDIADILALTLKKAKEIYYEQFWIKYNICAIPNLQIATKCLDLAVNMGPITAIKLLQESLNRCHLKPLIVDGALGNNTLEALGNHNILTNRLINDYRVSAAEHYEKLIQANPKLQKFRNGWLKRAAQ